VQLVQVLPHVRQYRQRGGHDSEIKMDKKIAGLLGAVGALASLNTAQAATATPAPTDVLKAQSFGDLLEPIPNALETLKAVDQAGSPPDVQLAQLFIEHHHHHHHHHHHGYYREDGPRIVVPGFRYRRYHHHHHHHHHHGYYRRYRED
jgi:hypothetical protein